MPLVHRSREPRGGKHQRFASNQHNASNFQIVVIVLPGPPQRCAFAERFRSAIMPGLKWLALKYAWKQRHHVLAAAASATTMVTTTIYSIAGIQRPLPIKVSDVHLVLNSDVPERLCRIKPYIELKVRSGVDRVFSKAVRTTHAQEDNHCDGRMIQFRDTLQLLAVPARDTLLVELWTRRRFLTPTRIGFCEIPLAALVADENSERQMVSCRAVSCHQLLPPEADALLLAVGGALPARRGVTMV
jgi:hypothetical protein